MAETIMNARKNRQMRTIHSDFTIRVNQENNERRIEGYFAVFGDIYEMYPGLTESIDPHAFDEAIADDVRFLINHDTTLVLGRTAAHTGELRIDSHGLWGSVIVNPNDSDATNALARVERGDVSQCSIGFDILDEEAEFREDGTAHWTIRKVKLYEVSMCTFPAYESTAISARQRDLKEIERKKREAWASGLLMKLQKKGENDVTSDSSQEQNRESE